MPDHQVERQSWRVDTIRTEPFSLLGQIVYEAGSPVARVHRLASLRTHTRLGIGVKDLLVSGRLDHLEFDLGDLPRVLQCVVNAYPEDSGLTAGLDLTANRTNLFQKSRDTAGTQLLAQRCVFVGAVADIGEHGHCVRYVDALTGVAFWNLIRCVGRVDPRPNHGGLHMNYSRLFLVPEVVSGRIIVVEVISPEVLVTLHIALAKYFAVTASIDLYAGLATLGQDLQYEGMICGGARRARYYTIDYHHSLTHEQRLQLPKWYKQRTSMLYDDKYPADFYVGRGTSVLQLSEEHARGTIHAPFKPWKLLVIPAVAELRNWRGEHQLVNARLANEVEAWLWAMEVEHERARSAMRTLYQLISEKVSPPGASKNSYSTMRTIQNQSSISGQYQSLEIVQSDALLILRRWKDYFPSLNLDLSTLMKRVDATNTERSKDQDDDHNDERSEDEGDTEDREHNLEYRVRTYLHKMSYLIDRFQVLIDDCKVKQREIAALRDGLFNGSAVLESRNSLRTADQSLEQTKTAIAQGENIKALTLVSIFFLPLAFISIPVTKTLQSIFGMTHLPESGNMTAFAICMVCICLPAYLLIGSMMDARGLKLWRDIIRWLVNRLPQSWTVPRYRTFQGMTQDSFRIANRIIEVSREGEKDRGANRSSKPAKSPRTTQGNAESQARVGFPDINNELSILERQSTASISTQQDPTSAIGPDTTQRTQTSARNAPENASRWKFNSWHRRSKNARGKETDVERGNTAEEN